MRTGGLRSALEHLRPADGGGLSDGQLLGRFLDSGEEAAFAALVRRHGRMVLGVCRRILGHAQDAEDAFQATFLVLARKAASVIRREALASFLYGVAYRTAVRARARAARRRATERQVQDMPHPEVAPPEAQDWRPVLDRELSRLPEKYRAVLVLCDLECQTRRQAARRLGLPEGTLASRLATARRMLARRLVRCGITLSGGALAGALSETAASAGVPALLLRSTVKAAVLIAAGRAAAVTTPAVALMNEVLGAMLMTKLKFAVAAVMVMVTLGTGGLAYRAAGQSEGKPPDRPRTEVEALRHEVELLKFNLEVVLEKCRAQEAELRALRGRDAAPQGAGGRGAGGFGGGVRGTQGYPSSPSTNGAPMGGSAGYGGVQGAGSGAATGGAGNYGAPQNSFARPTAGQGAFGEASGLPSRTVNPEQEVEEAFKALQEASDNEAKRRAAEKLEGALKKLRQQLQPPGTGQPPKKA
jgi:RNA polymerase sigma factor (sigma-70 family)